MATRHWKIYAKSDKLEVHRTIDIDLVKCGIEKETLKKFTNKELSKFLKGWFYNFGTKLIGVEIDYWPIKKEKQKSAKVLATLFKGIEKPKKKRRRTK